MTTTIELDDLVAATLDLSGRSEPWSSAIGLAYKLGLDLCARPCSGARLRGATIEYDRSASLARVQRLIADEIARWALLQWELLAPEPTVKRIAERLVRFDAIENEQGADGEAALLLPLAAALP